MSSQRALLIVDVQNDFVEGGSLAVQDGVAVAEKIEQHIRDNVHTYDAIVASMDWHQPDSTNSGHIALPPDEPDFIDSWPPHCIQGTEGADLHERIWDALDWVHSGSIVPVVTVMKGDGVPAYSAFEGVCEDGGGTLAQVLERLGIKRIDVVGIATDYCVRASVLDGLDEGFDVTVLTDMIAGVDPERSEAALELMKQGGASLL